MTSPSTEVDPVAEAVALVERLRSIVGIEGRCDEMTNEWAGIIETAISTLIRDRDAAIASQRAGEEKLAEVTRKPESDDWGSPALVAAERILYYLGIGCDASKEPWADRRRDVVCRHIEDATVTLTARITELEEQLGRTRETAAVCAKIIGVIEAKRPYNSFNQTVNGVQMTSNGETEFMTVKEATRLMQSIYADLNLVLAEFDAALRARNLISGGRE